ncbi:MAG: helix-turn-helix transcriptional regulator [Clostridia bacterium]|nr:helix-turn-helix transcriptional regulator [Clostridia bacterium]
MKNSNFPKYLSIPTAANSWPIETIEHTAWNKEDVAVNWVNIDYPFFHTHTHYEIFIIFGGEIIHTIDGKKYHLKAGDACLVRPNNRHNLVFDKASPDYLHINFSFRPEYFENILKNYSPHIISFVNNTNDFSPYKISSVELNYIKKYALKIQAFNQYTETDIVLCKSIINKLISYYVEQKYLKEMGSTSLPDWLNEFISFLYSPESFTLTIDELTKRTPYCHSRLYRIFKQQFHMSIIKFHNHIKLNHAKDLLTHSNDNTLEICNNIGFYSLSHFNHAFKKEFGITPVQYRKKSKL